MYTAPLSKDAIVLALRHAASVLALRGEFNDARLIQNVAAWLTNRDEKATQ